MVDLPGGGKLSHAAIYGQDGGMWAQSAGFPAVSNPSPPLGSTYRLSPLPYLPQVSVLPLLS